MICIGQAIIARLETTNGESFPIERFEDYQQLGRFTLRDQVCHCHPLELPPLKFSQLAIL